LIDAFVHLAVIENVIDYKTMKKYLVAILLLALLIGLPFIVAPRGASADETGPSFVLVVTRHGVRSPTHPSELAPYSTRAWPTWEVKPGYLTPHGALLMRQFGTYYRHVYQSAGIVPATGCPAAGSVFVWADIDERTLATGNALLDGIAHGCGLTVQHASLDKDDPLFDPLPTLGKADAALSRASTLGAIGNDPESFAGAYAPAFELLGRVLGCTAAARSCKPISKVPTTIDTDDTGLAAVNGGLDAAATAAENLLLAYTDGRSDAAWRFVDASTILRVMQLHALKSRIEHETWYNARAEGSNILSAITATLDQAASGSKNPGTRVPLSTRLAIIVGHDTTLSLLAGTLHLSWLVNGYQFNDTPPGGALVFEVYHPAGAATFVRLFFVAQSLQQMRRGEGTQPKRVPIFIPGCPAMDCPIEAFKTIVNGAIDHQLVAPWQ
jgi:4-phytase / acid phosphatase